MSHSNIRLFFDGSTTANLFWGAVVMFFLSFYGLYYLTTVLPVKLYSEAEQGQISDMILQSCKATPGCDHAHARIVFEERHYHLLVDVSGAGSVATYRAARKLWAAGRDALPWYTRMIQDIRLGDITQSSPILTQSHSSKRHGKEN